MDSLLRALEGNSAEAMLAFFLAQLVLACLATLVALRLLPRVYRKQKRSTGIYLFLLSLTVPLGGIIICLGAIYLAYRFPLKREMTNIREIDLPTFEMSLVERIKHGAGSRLRIQLDNVDAPVAERMTALLAMQAMPKRTASPILRSLLWDSVEDVRLLMYGMLDGAEKDITQKIHAELPKLAALKGKNNENERYAINYRLAQFYWELIYQNLVQDDIYRYTADQADHYATVALEIDANSASLWYMRGRLALTRRQPDEAAAFLKRAGQAGFPNDRLLPLIAECAYLHRNYAEVRTALNAFQNRSTIPFLQPLQRYWTS
ncbi:hypothetical protein D3C72_199640 [compost metagenome]